MRFPFASADGLIDLRLVRLKERGEVLAIYIRSALSKPFSLFEERLIGYTDLRLWRGEPDDKKGLDFPVERHPVTIYERSLVLSKL